MWPEQDGQIYAAHYQFFSEKKRNNIQLIEI